MVEVHIPSSTKFVVDLVAVALFSLILFFTYKLYREIDSIQTSLHNMERAIKVCK